MSESNSKAPDLSNLAEPSKPTPAEPKLAATDLDVAKPSQPDSFISRFLQVCLKRIEEYKFMADMEFELRARFSDLKTWENTIRVAAVKFETSKTTPPKLQTSVTLAVTSKLDGSKIRKEIIYKNGARDPETAPIDIRKVKLHDTQLTRSPSGVNTMKLSMSAESGTKPDTLKLEGDPKTKSFRLKYRICFYDAKWEHSFTAAVHLPPVIEEKLLQKVVSTLFGGVADHDNKVTSEKSGKANSDKTKVGDKVTRDRVLAWSEMLDNYLLAQDKLSKILVNPNINYEAESEYREGASNLTTDEITAVIANMNELVNSTNIDKEHAVAYHRLQKLLDTKNMDVKMMTNNPVELTKVAWFSIINDISSYYVSQKADGMRALLLIDDGTATVVTSAKTWDVEIKLALLKDVGTAVLDCEVLANKETEVIHIGDILPFDCLVENGKDVRGSQTNERLIKMEEVCKTLSDKKNVLAPKPYLLLDKDFRKQIDAVYKEKHKFENDGLVFTPMRATYMGKSSIYKWKPVENATIDFLALKATDDLAGTYPYYTSKGEVIVFLLCSGSVMLSRHIAIDPVPSQKMLLNKANIPAGNGDTIPLPFAPSRNPYAYIFRCSPATAAEMNGNICEMHPIDEEEVTAVNSSKSSSSTDQLGGHWELVKIRKDKAALLMAGKNFGNSFRHAESLYESFYNPLTLKDLIVDSAVQDKYFKTEANPAWNNMKGYNRAVSRQLLLQFASFDKLIDLASGQGQDINIYADYAVGKVLFVDQDVEALRELTQRKFNLRGQGTAIQTLAVNLNLSADKVIKKLARTGVPPSKAVVMNFAMHYFCETPESMDNIIKIVDSCVDRYGIFLWTCFDDVAIRELLDKNDGDYNKPPFRITKTGPNTIKVKHPFSGEDMYEEPIADSKRILQKFIDLGYEVRQTGRFGQWKPTFDKSSKSKKYSPNENDMHYSNLYGFWSVKKMK